MYVFGQRRRQVFWMSKQILQLVMEDAIDDWLLRQIYCLRREDNIALGIRWLQDVRFKLIIIVNYIIYVDKFSNLKLYMQSSVAERLQTSLINAAY